MESRGLVSVIGSKSGFPVNDQDFLEEMYSYFFYKRVEDKQFEGVP